MIGTDSTTKKIIKAVLKEDFAKQNNKIFSLSDSTYKNFKKVKKYLQSFLHSNFNDLPVLFSENIILISDNLNFYGKESVIKKLQSILDDFNPDKNPFKHGDISTNICMDIGEIKLDCHEDSDGSLFIIPWSHFFSCRLLLEYYNIQTKLDINYSIKFNDMGEISELILHKM